MKKILEYLTISVVLLATSIISWSKEPQGRDAALDAMSEVELINSMPLGKQADLIRKFQMKEATRLVNNDYNPKTYDTAVDTYRDKEVIIITIPTDYLFAPNATELNADAAHMLNPLKRYLKSSQRDMYRILLKVHTDNTGSEEYTDNLSLMRAGALFEWFDKQVGCSTDYLFVRAKGASEPARTSGSSTDIEKANDSMVKRAHNRRIEVYLIPGKKMVDAAKSGRIALK